MSNVNARVGGSHGAAAGFRSARGGFTLMELMLVVIIIGMALSVAMPRFMPAILTSEFEAAAHHLASYGRAAMAHCALYQQRLTVHIDLGSQEYWAMTAPDPAAGFFVESEGESEGELEGQGGLGALAGLGGLDDESGLAALFGLGGYGHGDEDEEIARRRGKRALSDFDQFAAGQLIERASNVKHEEGFLDDIGPDLNEIFTELDSDGEVEEPQEVTDPMLERTWLQGGDAVSADDLHIESIEVGGEVHSKGDVKIPVTPLGLREKVVIYLRNGEGDYYTIVWDVFTGDSHIYEGKETAV